MKLLVLVSRKESKWQSVVYLDSIKILETRFSYIKKLKEEINFCMTIANVQCVSQLWKSLLWKLLEGKILIFKTLALSKFFFEIFH